MTFSFQQVLQIPVSSSVKSMPYTSTDPVRNRHLFKRSSSDARAEPVGPGTNDPLIGRKVWTRWPADNSFYEALISNYDAAKVFLINFSRCF